MLVSPHPLRELHEHSLQQLLHLATSVHPCCFLCFGGILADFFTHFSTHYFFKGYVGNRVAVHPSAKVGVPRWLLILEPRMCPSSLLGLGGFWLHSYGPWTLREKDFHLSFHSNGGKMPQNPRSEFQSSTKIRYWGLEKNMYKGYDVESNGVQRDKQLNGGESQWFMYNVQYILYSLPPSIPKPRLSPNVGSYWWKKSQGQPPFRCF